MSANSFYKKNQICLKYIFHKGIQVTANVSGTEAHT